MKKYPLYVDDTRLGAVAQDMVLIRQTRRKERLFGGISSQGLRENHSVFAEFVIRGPQSLEPISRQYVNHIYTEFSDSGFALFSKR